MAESQDARNQRFMAMGYPPGPTKKVAKKLNLRDIYTYERLHQEYGDIFMLPLGDVPLVVTRSPEHIRDLLGGNGQVDFPRPPNVIANIQLLFGRAQIALDGEVHAENKKVLSNWLFNLKDNAEMVGPIWDLVTDFLNRMATGVGKGKSVEVYEGAELCASDLSAAISMGRTYKASQTGQCPQLDALKTCDRIFLNRAMNKRWKQEEAAETTKQFDGSRQLILDTLADGLDRVRSGRPAPDGCPLRHNIMTHMNAVNRQSRSAAHPEGKNPTEFEMLCNMVGFLAGVGNTARLFSISIEKLSRMPQYQQTILEELHRVSGLSEQDAREAALLGQRIDERPEVWTYEALDKLEFTRCFMHECLRLYTPSVSVAPRECTKEGGSEFANFKIPPGTKMMCNIFGSHRHPKFWDRAEVFDPMRWNEAKPGEPVSCLQFAPEGFFPFGYGAHSCIGKNLAQLTCVVILARLVGRFGILPKEGSAPATFNTTNSEQILGFTEAIGGVHVNLVERPVRAGGAVTARAGPSVQPTAAAAAPTQAQIPRGGKHTWEEVKKHTTRDSLWFVLNKQVYDVTPFLNAHPGGEKILVRQGGKDATRAFDMINHSTSAKKLAQEYCIGDLLEAKL
eukprot:TRINITY_DN46753_c0_g1_i1.p1 TRINITY_DN46753_c0_g1~~TRINITY_DN46753_c0_g1_i1.p1  ORF type:complete len:639 (+),score=207.03 TRINITY_DN46753_c0_g1_i1:55-1917(+)